MQHVIIGILALVSICCVSCKKQPLAPLKPYMVVLPKEKMVQVIIDISLAEATTKNYIMYNHIVYLDKSFYTKLYTKHQITEKQFVWNLMNYSRQKQTSNLYELAINKITEQKAVLEQKMLKDKN